MDKKDKIYLFIQRCVDEKVFWDNYDFFKSEDPKILEEEKELLDRDDAYDLLFLMNQWNYIYSHSVEELTILSNLVDSETEFCLEGKRIIYLS
jgi:hypothetical protein